MKVYFLIVLISAVFGVLFLGSDPDMLDSEVEQRGQSTPSTNDLVKGAFEQKTSYAESRNARVELRQKLIAAKNLEEMSQVLRDALQENESLVHHVMSSLDCREINCSSVVQSFIAFYRDEGRLLDGLEAFHVMKGNIDISLEGFKPLLVLSATEDLDKTFEWCLKNADTGLLVEGFEEVATLCVERGDQEAYIQSVFESNMDDFSQASFLRGVLETWIEEDSNAALQYFAEFPQSDALDLCLITSIESITKVDPVAACQWAQYITDKDLLRVALESVLEQWAVQDLEMYEVWQDQNPEEYQNLQQLIKL